jgi:methionine-S-sulfoxide reductase
MIEGVVDTEVGYIAGPGATSYQEVCNASGHAEAVYIQYDENKVSLNTLLDHLFNIIDPTSINKQGNDIGIQYRSGIYNYTDSDLEIINAYIARRAPEYKRPIALELKSGQEFYSGEEYHQDYLEKNKHGYCHVDLNSHKNVK